MALKVSTVPVNADKPEEFYDIKNVWKPPFVLADYYPWIFGVLLTLFLICVVAYVIKRMRNRQSILPFKKPEPKLPPHEQAIKELDEIKQQKLWQQGRSKEYYTLITDTLRRYIVDRFGINAMEMTSGEILDIIRKQQEATSVYESLKQIMQLADFVKFAKMNPLPDENDLSLMNGRFAYPLFQRQYQWRSRDGESDPEAETPPEVVGVRKGFQHDRDQRTRFDGEYPDKGGCA